MIKRRVIYTPIVIVAIICAAIFIYRYQILIYSIESLIRNNLPPYVTIDRMIFDLKGGRAEFRGLKITNPNDFSYKFMLEVRGITCRYKMRGKSILSGIEILDPVFSGGVMDVERLEDKRVNLSEMQKVMEEASRAKRKEAGPSAKDLKQAPKQGIVKLSDLVKLPENFTLKNGSVAFTDRSVSPSPHVVTFENINALFSLRLDDSYSKVISFASTGTGNINGNADEVVSWTIVLDPNTPRITMSNRFEVSGVDIVSFEPYYDKYSPFVFKRGTFSGTLIFDFDNGNIGSTNEVHLSGLVFYVKSGYENAAFWETTVPDLQKYFTSPAGDIVFDFKIKGDMASPKFYLGPISKQALASMAIDKVAKVISEASQKGSGGASDKVNDYVGLFKALVNKR